MAPSAHGVAEAGTRAVALPGATGCNRHRTQSTTPPRQRRAPSPRRSAPFRAAVTGARSRPLAVLAGSRAVAPRSAVRRAVWLRRALVLRSVLRPVRRPHSRAASSVTLVQLDCVYSMQLDGMVKAGAEKREPAAPRRDAELLMPADGTPAVDRYRGRSGRSRRGQGRGVLGGDTAPTSRALSLGRDEDRTAGRSRVRHPPIADHLGGNPSHPGHPGQSSRSGVACAGGRRWLTRSGRRRSVAKEWGSPAGRFPL